MKRFLKMIPIAVLIVCGVTSCGTYNTSKMLNSEESKEIALQTELNVNEKSDNYTGTIDNIDEPDYPEMLITEANLDEIIKLSSSFVLARCNGLQSESPDALMISFELETVLCGEKMPDMFNVKINTGDYCFSDGDNNYMSVESPFVDGNKYLLPLSRYSSVFRNEDVYVFNEAYVEVKDDNSVSYMYVQGKKSEGLFKTVDGAYKYLEDNGIDCEREHRDTAFTRSDDIDDIISMTDYIVSGYIKDIFLDLNDRTTFYFTVEKSYKSTWDKQGDILVVLPKDSVEIGEKYVLLLNQIGNETSTAYTIPSINKSVYPAESADAQKIIEIVKSLS